MHSGESAQQNSSAAQKLEGLTEVPAGFRFNASGVWNQLEANLQPVRKKPVAYHWWTVAAILLLLVAGGIFLQPDPVSKPVMATTKKGKEVPVVVIVPPSKTTEPAQVQKAVSIKKVLPGKLVKTELPIAFQKEMMAVSASDTIPRINAALVSPAAETAVAAPLKPRFRIVHANELHMPVVPVEVLNDAARPTYGFLRRPANEASPADDKTVEEPPVKKQPKTLMGLFNSN